MLFLFGLSRRVQGSPGGVRKDGGGNEQQ